MTRSHIARTGSEGLPWRGSVGGEGGIQGWGRGIRARGAPGRPSPDSKETPWEALAGEEDQLTGLSQPGGPD